MNIQPINFTAKQRYEYHCPHLSTSVLEKKEPINIQNMATQAIAAHITVPKIITASKEAQKESREIINNAEKIQQKADEIMAEIIDTSVFNSYLRNLKNNELYTTYISKIKLDDGEYEIKVIPNCGIFAAKTIGDSKDIYTFDARERTLTQYVKNSKSMGRYSKSEAEYSFDCLGLNKCDLNVYRGEIGLISKRFEFDNIEESPSLEVYTSNLRVGLGQNSAKEIFVYGCNDVLESYERNCTQDQKEASNTSSKFYYQFDEKENLTSYRKDYVHTFSWQKASLVCEYQNPNEFYVQANFDTRKCPEYDAICFYQDGSIEGSII